MSHPPNIRILAPCLCLISISVACSDSETQAGVTASGRTIPLIYTVNYPLQYLAERIGGGAVQVEFPTPADEDPAYWKPDAETVALYQNADRVMLNGAGYAEWITSATLPMSAMVDTSREFADRYIQIENAVTHTHGPTGEHSHGSTAFTTWLDPTLAVEQARAIASSLGALLPEQEERLRENFLDLERDLMAVDSELTSIVAADPERPLLGSHPVYQYLTSKYGLNLHSVHWEPDEMPSEEEWENLETILADHPAKWMLWEGEPTGETAARLRALGVESAVFNPCGNVPEKGNFLGVMRQNVQNLRRAFQ